MLENLMNIEYRKNYTKNKIIKLKEFFLSIFDDKNTAGWFSSIFLHYGPHLIFLILFLILPFNFMFLVPWIIGFCLHIFFKGCIHLRLERALFDDKKWAGAYYILESVGIDTTNSENIIKAMKSGLILILVIFIIKFIIHKYSDTSNNIFYIDNPIYWFIVIWWILQFIGLIII